jgi:hypothetical protein
MSEPQVQQSTPPKKKAPAPQTAGRGFYSGANPIPTVQEFIEKLDVGKKQRDQDLENKEKQKQQPQEKVEIPEAQAPQQPLKAGKGQKIVTDPVTGNEVVIEKATQKMAVESDNPKV